MYYKFNGFTQRLVGSPPLPAYTPQGLRPAVPVEPPKMIFASPTKIVPESTATAVEYMGVNKVPDLQKIFQGEGRPVHLKMGIPDKLLYRTTMALTIGGTLYCLIALYLAAQPRK